MIYNVSPYKYSKNVVLTGSRGFEDTFVHYSVRIISKQYYYNLGCLSGKNFEQDQQDLSLCVSCLPITREPTGEYESQQVMIGIFQTCNLSCPPV